MAKLPFVHLELTTPDLAAAKAFYGELCGWTYQDHQMPAGVYSIFQTDSGPGGGMFTMPGAPTQWTPYIGVENLKESTDKAVSHGAKLLHGDTVEGMGAFSILLDPTGAMFALWEPKKA